MFTVYVLRSSTTEKLYVGQTKDLMRRLAEHNTGLARLQPRYHEVDILLNWESLGISVRD